MNPHSPPPCDTLGEEIEKIGSEVEPGKKGGLGSRCFKIYFLLLITLV